MTSEDFRGEQVAWMERSDIRDSINPTWRPGFRFAQSGLRLLQRTQQRPIRIQGGDQLPPALRREDLEIDEAGSAFKGVEWVC